MEAFNPFSLMFYANRWLINRSGFFSGESQVIPKTPCVTDTKVSNPTSHFNQKPFTFPIIKYSEEITSNIC